MEAADITDDAMVLIGKIPEDSCQFECPKLRSRMEERAPGKVDEEINVIYVT